MCVRREICVSKLIGLACSGKEIYHFCFVLLCIRGQIPSTSPPGGLYSEGRFNGRFFVLRFWGAFWRGIFSEFYGILSGRYQYPPSLHALKDRWDKKEMLRGFSGGKQVIKSANTRNRSRVCLFWKTKNEELFILKTIMANYRWKWSLLLFWMQ